MFAVSPHFWLVAWKWLLYSCGY